MATALVSALSNRPVRKHVAMTGEITLRGNVLPIGGVKEKVLAAYRAKITKVILPALNQKDMEEVPEEAQKGMEFVFVDHVRDVFKEALAPLPKQAAEPADNRSNSKRASKKPGATKPAKARAKAKSA
jgi:ATP-dependent Lon protease